MENTTENNKENTPRKKRNKGRILLIVLVALLVVLNGIILYQLHTVKTEKEKTEERLASSEDLREKLEAQLHEIELQLEDYKGRNAEKDAELEEKAEEIRQLLQEKEITQNKYRKAQKDLDVYKYYAQKYMAQIDSLDRANKELTQENVTLKQDIKKRKLESDQIKDENVLLSNKVSLGSKLSAENVQVTGVRFRRNGNERETDRSRRIEQLKVCFDIGENVIADPGTRDVYIRIVNPRGEVVQNAEVGMGSFGLGQKKIDYSMRHEIFYDNKAENYCMYFNKGAEFMEGVHKIEIYTDEQLMATREYEIK